MGASASVPDVRAHVEKLNPVYSKYARAVEEMGIDVDFEENELDND